MNENEREKQDYLRSKVEEFLRSHNTTGLLYESQKKEALTLIDESESEFTITIKIPAVGKENINIMLTGKGVLITAKKKLQVEGNDDVHYRYGKYAEFSQYITLPEGIDRRNIKAKYAMGYLVLYIPKLSEEIKLDFDN